MGTKSMPVFSPKRRKKHTPPPLVWGGIYLHGVEGGRPLGDRDKREADFPFLPLPTLRLPSRLIWVT